jgi:dienelactone hydrolase
MRRPRVRAAAAVVAVALAAWWLARPPLIGLLFIARAASFTGATRRVADLEAVRFREFLANIPRRDGRGFRARVFQPLHARRAALLVSGVHPAGIDEPRLLALARDLASANVTIVTPDIPELSQFDITPSITDAIEDAAVWLGTSELANGRAIGLLGISFSGGLSVVAAGRPSLAGRLAYVFSLGGHDDLPRVLRYLCTGVEPLPAARLTLDPEHPSVFARAPHDYAVAVLLFALADRVVPPAQVDGLRVAVRRYLWASHLDTVDKPAAQSEFEALRRLASALPEPSATLMRYVNARDVVHLGGRLLPVLGSYGTASALSASRSPKPTVPVFLLHGRDDNVIPAVEADYLRSDLQGHAPVHLLISDLISHAELDRAAGAAEIVRLSEFWGGLLTQ